MNAIPFPFHKEDFTRLCAVLLLFSLQLVLAALVDHADEQTRAALSLALPFVKPPLWRALAQRVAALFVAVSLFLVVVEE